MIYFDEKGLPEISSNNPLKVIQLEYKKEDLKLVFVGISNWTLDASKKNKGIYIAVIEPDLKDCIDTTIEIVNSYYDNLSNWYNDTFILLAKSYVEFVKDIILREHPNFDGVRDFYHVIKFTCKNSLKKH